MHDNMTCSDTLEVYSIDDSGTWHKQFETNNYPSLFQRLLMKLGLYRCAGDALTNWMINRHAIDAGTTLLYASVGTSSSSATDYTLTDLVSPVMTRVPVTVSYLNTYGSDPDLPDTAQFIITMTATSGYTLLEAGLHTAVTGGHMGSRQTFPDWAVTNGSNFAMVWKIAYGRG